MIIIGYQGIGKSTLAGKMNCIDLESGNFWVNGKRAEDWYIPYCQIANHLSEQGYTVFVSSHEVVRNELKKSKERVVVICPAVELRDEWVAKLEDRYGRTGLEKDFKAWKNAEDRYEENIKELGNDSFDVFYIKGMSYILKLIVLMLQNNLELTQGYYDELVVQYEEFPEEDIKVLTVSKGNGLDESLYMLQGEEARSAYLSLKGGKFEKENKEEPMVFTVDPYRIIADNYCGKRPGYLAVECRCGINLYFPKRAEHGKYLLTCPKCGQPITYHT